MYNRYIPQPDGSYSKRTMPEPPHSHPPRRPAAPPPPPTPDPEPEGTASLPPPPKPEAEKPPVPKPAPPCRTDAPAGNFLRQLLPKEFDTGDLMVLLLLLLIAGDCAEDQNTALLTLMLYFYM